jgi:hypothetical protein
MTYEDDDLGITLSRVNAAKVEMANDAMTRVTATTTAFKQELTTQLAPVVAGLGDLFTGVAKKHGGMAKFISSGLQSLAKGVGFVADGFQGWKVILKGVEVIWKGFTSAFKVAAQGIVNITHEMGKAIFKAVVSPIKTALELAGTFSDEAKELAKTVDNFTNAKPIKLFDDDGINDLRKVKVELLDLANTPMPSKGIDKWYKENREKFQKLSEEYAAGINRNDPDAPAQNIQTPAEKAAEKAAARKAEIAAKAEGRKAKALEREREQALSSSRNEMDNIRQSFLNKSALEAEQWEVRQQQLNTWRELEIEALQGNKAKIQEVEQAHTDLTEKNYKNHRKNLEKLEDAKNQTRLQSAQKVFDGLGGLAKAFSGEQSTAYRLMFAAQKAYSLASVLLSSKEAISKAWASAAFPYNLPAVGVAIAETGALKAAVSAITTPSYHTGGISGQPADTSSTQLRNNEIYAKLLKGEEVLTQKDPRHRNNISNSSSPGKSSNTFTIIINNNSQPVSATAQMDDEGRIQIFLEKADEYIGEAISAGFSKTGAAIQSHLGGNRVGYR